MKIYTSRYCRKTELDRYMTYLEGKYWSPERILQWDQSPLRFCGAPFDPSGSRI